MNYSTQCRAARWSLCAYFDEVDTSICEAYVSPKERDVVSECMKWNEMWWEYYTSYFLFLLYCLVSSTPHISSSSFTSSFIVSSSSCFLTSLFLRTLIQIWKSILKSTLEKQGVEAWIGMASIKFRLPKKVWNFLTSWTNINFQWRFCTVELVHQGWL